MMDNTSTLTAIDEIYMIIGNDSDPERYSYADMVRSTMIAAVALYESPFLAHVASGHGAIERKRPQPQGDRSATLAEKALAICHEMHLENHHGMYLASSFAINCRTSDDLYSALARFFNQHEFPTQHAELLKRGVSAGMVALAKIISDYNM